MTRLILSTLVVLTVIVGWYILADRATPYTQNARVKAIITPIVPQVSGTVTEILIDNAELVTAGAELARIDPRPFEIAAQRARADVARATQDVGANAAAVARAQAALTQARSALETARLQSARVFELEAKGLVPTAQADAARNELAAAESAVTIAEADLDAAREALGPEGADNPQLVRALADLAAAELDLACTTLSAPSLGAVVDLAVSAGAQAQQGQPLMTFVDGRDLWIEAYMSENNLSAMHVGDPAEVVLDMVRGRVFPGRVQSITGAVSAAIAGPDGLPQPPQPSGWLRQPQRVPVRIVLDGPEAADFADDVRFILNGQANVFVYTGDQPLLNALGGALIRVTCWLSYAY